jgi:hypothetical protein
MAKKAKKKMTAGKKKSSKKVAKKSQKVARVAKEDRVTVVLTSCGDDIGAHPASPIYQPRPPRGQEPRRGRASSGDPAVGLQVGQEVGRTVRCGTEEGGRVRGAKPEDCADRREAGARSGGRSNGGVRGTQKHDPTGSRRMVFSKRAVSKTLARVWPTEGPRGESARSPFSGVEPHRRGQSARRARSFSEEGGSERATTR